MRRILVAGALTLAIATVAAIAPVVAADLPQAPPPAPRAPVFVPAPVYNWSGIYVGINGGYGFGSSGLTTTGTALDSGCNFNLSGGKRRRQLGFNYQINQFVMGVEGDFDWAGPSQCSTSNGICGGAAFAPCTDKRIPGSAPSAAAPASRPTGSCSTAPPAVPTAKSRKAAPG